MNPWSTATPEEILADLRTIVESQPPVPDASTGTWRRWAIEPDGRVVLVEHPATRDAAAVRCEYRGWHVVHSARSKPLQEGANHKPGARRPGYKKAPPVPRWARKRGKQ